MSESPKKVEQKTERKVESSSEMLGRKLPWLLGKKIRIPRIRWPTMGGRSYSLPTPPRYIAMVLIYILLFFVMMGGVYLITPRMGQDPMPALGADSSGNPVWLYPSIHDAFIIESIVGATLFFMGAVGFIALFNSTKHSLNPSYGRKILALGIGLVLAMFVVMQYVIYSKETGKRAILSWSG